MEMDDTLYKRITSLTDVGNDFFAHEDFEKAILNFKEALKLIPEPVDEWQTTLWLYTSIGDCYFLLGDDISALEYFQNAYNCPGANTNPFILLRLGESYFEMSNFPAAGEFLTRAYMLEGLKIFEEEEPKYLSFLKEILNEVR